MHEMDIEDYLIQIIVPFGVETSGSCGKGAFRIFKFVLGSCRSVAEPENWLLSGSTPLRIAIQRYNVPAS